MAAQAAHRLCVSRAFRCSMQHALSSCRGLPKVQGLVSPRQAPFHRHYSPDVWGNRPDTIVAVSSGSLPCGVAVLRVSGPAASKVLRAIAPRACDVALASPRSMRLTSLRHAVLGHELDRGMVVWFPGPASFTGQDVVEVHCHGSRAVVGELLASMTELGRCGAGQETVRPAAPGEFTRRALASGKLSLTAAEGLGDLLNAVTPHQRRAALAQMDGALAHQVQGWRERLVRVLAHLEACVDFGDEEEDIGEEAAGGAMQSAAELCEELRGHLARSNAMQRAVQGVSMALVGPPNAGKSSLLNAVIGAPVSIVSAQAGTTRDVVSAQATMAGVPVQLADTAGLRQETQDAIERAGMQRAREVVADASVAVVVVDVADAPPLPDVLPHPLPATVLVALNKIDLLQGDARQAAVQSWEQSLSATLPAATILPVSAVTGEGVPQLLACLGQGAERAMAGGLGASGEDTGALLTRERHQHAVAEAVRCLDSAAALWAGGGQAHLPILAEEVRQALMAVGEVAGEATSEDVLDVLFADFCVGK